MYLAELQCPGFVTRACCLGLTNGLGCNTRLVELDITSYTARATRYTARYTMPLHGPKKRSLEKMVSLDISLQRHLTGTLESSLQDVFRRLLKHQQETNCKLRLLRFRARACAIARPAVAIVCAFPCTSQEAGARSLPMR